MAWTIEFGSAAKKDLAQLHPVSAKRILSFLKERVATAQDPRALGMALKGSRLGEFWRYRVGDHRVIVAIEDSRVRVLVVRIGHRGEVYR